MEARWLEAAVASGDVKSFDAELIRDSDRHDADGRGGWGWASTVRWRRAASQGSGSTARMLPLGPLFAWRLR